MTFLLMMPTLLQPAHESTGEAPPSAFLRVRVVELKDGDVRRRLDRFRLWLRERRQGAWWEGRFAEGVLVVGWSCLVLVG